MIINGDETEKEFLMKCLEHWEAITNIGVNEKIKLIKIATIFHEMRHRVDEMQ